MRLLLLKLPYSPHPEAAGSGDFRARGTFRPMPSLALASLAAWVGRHGSGVEVEAVDVNLAAYVAPSQPADITLLPGALAAAIRDHQYDVLGLSAPFVFNIRWLREAVRLSRLFHPDAKIIAGGGLPTLLPGLCIDNGVDIVINGEGEESLEWLLTGTALKDFQFKILSSSVVDKQDVTRLPPPAWHLLNVESYFQRSGERLLPIEVSRGCPQNCSFCTVTGVWGPRVRYKMLDRAILEIAELVSTYHVDKLWFIDDNLTFRRDWAVEFLTRLAANRFPVQVDASNFSIKHLDEELIDLLAGAGFKRISVAIESGSPEIQKQIGKHLDLEQAVKTVELIKKRGLAVHLCWMVGFPGETPEQTEMTYALARKLRADSNQFCTVVPFPGTRIYDEAKAAGFLVPATDKDLDQYNCYGAELFQRQQWTYEQLRNETYKVNIEVNFLKNPQLETEAGRERFLKFAEGLLLRLPDHVVAQVLAGFLRGLTGDELCRTSHYQAAIRVLDDPKTSATFRKYIQPGHPALDDFLAYQERTKP